MSKLDQLIANLETALEDAVNPDYEVKPGEKPRPAQFKILSTSFTSVSDRKTKPAEVHRIKDGELVMRSRADVPRNINLETRILVSKDRLGETQHVLCGKVLKTTRVSGAYEIRIQIEDVKQKSIPVQSRLLDCVNAGDAATWNRWCADLNTGPILVNIDLSQSVLTNFDLCCADLSGSNLEGANLSGANLAGANLSKCNLDGVQIAGADLFRTRLPRMYMGLLIASGMIEVESVILE